MKTISIQSFKGGTGKTTATANIAYALNKYHGKKVLVVEADAHQIYLVILALIKTVKKELQIY
jgi:cellulose biosynthesis protein BcsQ|nr:MAG TPA: ParA [Caudoviricetes sp.]